LNQPDGAVIEFISYEGVIKATNGPAAGLSSAGRETSGGTTALTGSLDNTARLWDVATGRALGPPLTHRSNVWAVAFSPDGKTLASGAQDGTVKIRDVTTGADTAAFARHAEVVEIECNPLIVGSSGAVAVDVRVRVEPAPMAPPEPSVRPFS
jgi:WD40 repeat protein